MTDAARRLRMSAPTADFWLTTPSSHRARWARWGRALESRWACRGLLTAWCALLFAYGLGAGDLWRTESLRAVIAREMLETGDWLVPRLYGEPLFTKPPGMYLAIVLCSLPLGGVTEWSARLPSALAACACVGLFAWHFGRRLGRTAGLAAGLILPMAFMWLDKATAAEIDMLQTAWVTASILFFLRATEESTAASGKCSVGSGKGEVHHYSPNTDHCSLITSSWWIAACLCMAGGVLTKWTAPQFFYGTALTYLWWTGRLRLLLRRPHLVGAGLAAAIVSAWIAAASIRAGWQQFFDTVLWEGLSRLLPGYNTWRPYPWGEAIFHPLKIVLNTLPWSALALLTLRPSFVRIWDERERSLLIALHCWVWPQVLFWSLVTEHTPRHSFPIFPGIAGLAVMVFHAWHSGRLPWRMPALAPARLLAVCAIGWLIIKVAYVEAVVPERDLRRQTSYKGAVLAVLVPAQHDLHLFTTRNEGLMFYCRRNIVRADAVDSLPSPALCVLSEPEWRGWDHPRRVELVQRLDDEQGDPIYLVRVE
jgi:4-amino-4-deoxy-L-arabinose transferase-like glycosyltransferase